MDFIYNHPCIFTVIMLIIARIFYIIAVHYLEKFDCIANSKTAKEIILRLKAGIPMTFTEYRFLFPSSCHICGSRQIIHNRWEARRQGDYGDELMGSGDLGNSCPRCSYSYNLGSRPTFEEQNGFGGDAGGPFYHEYNDMEVIYSPYLSKEESDSIAEWSYDPNNK